MATPVTAIASEDPPSSAVSTGTEPKPSQTPSDPNGTASPIGAWTVAIVGATIGGFFAYLMYDKYKRHVRCVLNPRRPATVDRFVHQYIDLIEDCDRVSPDKLAVWLGDKRYSPKTMRAMHKLWMADAEDPIHLLVVAKSGNEVVGFVKAIALRKSRQLYVGFFGAQNVAGIGQGEISRHLVAKLELIIAKLDGVEWLSFEITGSGSRSISRWRLFSDFARKTGHECLHLDGYVLPEADGLEALTVPSELALADAGLFGLVPLSERSTTMRELQRAEAALILRDVYFRVYLFMFRMPSEPAVEYDAYIRRFFRLWFVASSDPVRLLRQHPELQKQ
ncbi:hypothetical protein HYX70_02720 [Candidatus Saccharibacteria bacterium]|nr:hypothetical protein [Candidatus Saccharibacteria bacterium]